MFLPLRSIYLANVALTCFRLYFADVCHVPLRLHCYVLLYIVVCLPYFALACALVDNAFVLLLLLLWYVSLFVLRWFYVDFSGVS